MPTTDGGFRPFLTPGVGRPKPVQKPDIVPAGLPVGDGAAGSGSDMPTGDGLNPTEETMVRPAGERRRGLTPGVGTPKPPDDPGPVSDEAPVGDGAAGSGDSKQPAQTRPSASDKTPVGRGGGAPGWGNGGEPFRGPALGDDKPRQAFRLGDATGGQVIGAMVGLLVLIVAVAWCAGGSSGPSSVACDTFRSALDDGRDALESGDRDALRDAADRFEYAQRDTVAAFQAGVIGSYSADQLGNAAAWASSSLYDVSYDPYDSFGADRALDEAAATYEEHC